MGEAPPPEIGLAVRLHRVRLHGAVRAAEDEDGDEVRSTADRCSSLLVISASAGVGVGVGARMRGHAST